MCCLVVTGTMCVVISVGSLSGLVDSLWNAGGRTALDLVQDWYLTRARCTMGLEAFLARYI